MRAVSWKFSGKCNLCLGKVDPKTKNCSRHDKKGCDSDDCAHYVAINSRPFCCVNAKVVDQRLQRTWIQVSAKNPFIRFHFRTVKPTYRADDYAFTWLNFSLTLR